jgi:3-methylcrotonyl-CoA carboxylase alpha subunit
VTVGLRGFRLNAPNKREENLDVEGETRKFEFRPTAPGQKFEHGFVDIHQNGNQFVQIEGDLVRLSWPRADAGGHHSAHDGDILAPMPGKVIAVDVAEGQAVEAGQRLLVLEAMKMEHALTAPFAGTVAELSAKEGQQVQVEALLARVEKAED